MTVQLRVEPLTQVKFAPFGTVIETFGAASFPLNGGASRRFHALAEMDVLDDGGRPILSIQRTDPQTATVKVTSLRRHMLGSQAFYPLGSYNWLIVVAEGEAPSAGDCKCFLAGACQGVQFAKRVWHHPLIALSEPVDFLVADRAGPGEPFEGVAFKDGPATLNVAALVR